MDHAQGQGIIRSWTYLKPDIRLPCCLRLTGIDDDEFCSSLDAVSHLELDLTVRQAADDIEELSGLDRDIAMAADGSFAAGLQSHLQVRGNQLNPLGSGFQEEIGQDRHRGLPFHDPLHEGELAE